MIAAIIQRIVKFRNPAFEINPALNWGAIYGFIWITLCSLLRGLKWAFYLKNPKMALLGKGVNWFNSPKITFGKFLKLGDHVYLSALGSQGIILGDNVGIGAFSRLIVSTSLATPGEFIKIGNHVGIGEYAYLGGGGGLEIGDESIIGQYFSCHPENHTTQDYTKSIRLQGVTRKGIKIGSNCWVGSKVTVLDGVEIGNSCIVAAGAVVTKSFPDYSVIGGIPAKLIKSRI